MTATRTETWNRTHARKVAGKVMADLLQMRQAYGQPSREKIDLYLEELVELLAAGYLDKVTYGFKRNGDWIIALTYTAAELGSATSDDLSGGIPRGTNVENTTWGSYLCKSQSFHDLPLARRLQIEGGLPIERTSGDEPSSTRGWSHDKTYSSGGGGVRRSTLGGRNG